MEKQIDEKLESLLKYVPFIDYIIKIDSEKYVKFIDIKNWIIKKKRYPLSDLNKIEQSITTQYKNIFIEDKKIPQEIEQIFKNNHIHQYVNLCSDDEDSTQIGTKVDVDKQKKYLSKSMLGGRSSRNSADVRSDSEDDVEIVSISYPQKSVNAESDNQITPKREDTRKNSSVNTSPPVIDALDDASAKLLKQIDKISFEDKGKNEYVEPHNYHLVLSDDEYETKAEILFQRRPRQDDCKSLEENKQVKKPKRRCSNFSPIARSDTISLDSTDDEETTIKNKVESSPNTEKTISKNGIISGSAVLKANNVIEQNCSMAIDASTLYAASSTSSTHCNNNSAEYETENLSHDKMCRLIESKVKKLDGHQLQALLKEIVRKGSSTEAQATLIESDLPSSSKSGNGKPIERSISRSPPPPAPRIKPVVSTDVLLDASSTEPQTTLIESDLPSSSNSGNGKPIETSLSRSPPPLAPRIEPVESTDVLLDAIYRFLEKVQKTEQGEAVGVNSVKAPRNNDNYENQQNISPFTQTSHQYQYHRLQQQQHFNHYNNPAMCHHENAVPQPIYPHAFAPFNQQARSPHNTDVWQTFASAQASLKSRDPRARSALYQNYLKIIEAEVAKRNSAIQNGNLHNLVPPVLPPNSSSVAVNQLTEIPSSILPLQQQCYKLSTGVTPSNIQTYQQPHEKQNSFKNFVQPSESTGGKTRKATLTYGEYKRRKSEEKNKLEKQREEEKRHEEAMLTRIDGASYEQYDSKRRQAEEQRKIDALLEEKKNQQDKKEKEDALLEEKRIQEVNKEKADLINRQAEALKRKEAEDLEIKEDQKKRFDIRSILFTALQPYEDKIEKVWNTNKDPIPTEQTVGHETDKNNPITECGKDNDDTEESKLMSGEKENANDICVGKKRKNDVLCDAAKEISNPKSKKSHTGEDNSDSTNNSTKKKKSDVSKSNNRINRIFKEMECTFKGYDQSCKTVAGKRRSNIHARMAISAQLNNSQENAIQDDTEPLALTIDAKRHSNLNGKQLNVSSGSSTHNDSPQPTAGGKICSSIHSSLVEETSDIQYFAPPVRRSSIHARSAIAKQLNSQSSMDSSDSYIPFIDNISCSSTSSAHSTNSPQKKDINAINHLVDETSDSETNACERFRVIKAQKLRESILKRQPSIVLRRLKEDEIKKHCKTQEKPKSNNILNVRLIESGVRPDTINDISKPSVTTSKKSPPKKYNNDCEMTERSTKFCVLCSSKPSDLTNHYKRKHKCESYVSRLTWSELDELCINTPFAKQVPSSNGRVDRFSVVCPFCDEKLVEPFMNLYNHYASHTGEYAFQCAACQLDKPFKADIQSHQLHSKTCRNSQIQTMYRYPSNTMSIYLHYCNICNYVQLNEANIFKHLREHHDPRKSTPENVQKCILAAISDGPESNSNESQTISSDDTQGVEINKPVPETEARVIAKSEIDLNLDDNIPVFNEAFSEDPFDLEERLKQMHEEQPTGKNPHQEPTTVLHLEGQSSEVGKLITEELSRHVPKAFKSEAMDLDEKFLLTPPRPSTLSSESCTKIISSYRIYRPYPANVNYLGFYKCITGDCFYSSDSAEEFVNHLEDHMRENLPGEYLLCPYCNISAGFHQSVHQLVDHIRTQHSHLLYQCSLCCYRSCDASNVLVHQKENHSSNLQDCKIYKCPGTELSPNNSYIRENMNEFVGKIQCPYCSNLFYSTRLLTQHISTNHKSNIQERIERYSCIYCLFCDQDQSVTRKHVALNHPGELPFLCDHNSSTVTEDSLHNLEYTSLAQRVPVIEVPATYNTLSMEIAAQNSNFEDIKPSVEDLVRCQTDLVNIRLRKLTEKTGVAPDCLYRCPELSCGGFFSNYDLWLRHMRIKHHCLENKCPHCPIETTKSLEDFKFHLEDHRRHTYICFHCPQTFANSQHAQDHWIRDHGDLGLMHVEEIRYNINYAYYILIQPKNFENRPELLTSLCDVFDRRIKDLESIEAAKLKNKWLIPSTSTTLWLDEYPKHVLTPKLVKKCFNGNCNFRTKSDETLFSHVRSNHVINGSIFKCSKCDFRLENSLCWDDALNHIKQHSETSFFICGACSNHYLCRSKISEHIRSEHAARDVPIVNLLRRGQLLYAAIGFVFANERLTFSTMRNCFCCEERNMKADAFTLHLKRYHRFVLNYFCEWCNLPLDSLQSVETHFQQNHTTNKLKLRAELASKANLSIQSVNELQIQISGNLSELSDARTSTIVVKQDPDADDSVIIVEDDDIVVENFMKSREKIEENAEKPKLKCIATDSLLSPSKNFSQLRILPRVKIIQKKQSISDSPPIYYPMSCADKTAPIPPIVAEHLQPPIPSNNNTIASDSNIQTDSIISSQRITLPSSSVQKMQTSSFKSTSSANNNAISIQPNTNISSYNMMPSNQYGPVFSGGSTKVQLSLPSSKRPSINNSAYVHPVQRTSGINGVVSSLSSAVGGPHYTYTNSLPQSVTHNTGSYDNRNIQNNLQFTQNPMTSFQSSHLIPTPATTDLGVTNTQHQHIMTFPTDANTFPAINSSLSRVNAPTPATTDLGVTNTQHQHIMTFPTDANTFPAINSSLSRVNAPHTTMTNTYNFQNISHPSNISQGSAWPMVYVPTAGTSTGTMTLDDYSPHTVGKTSSTNSSTT